MSALKELLEEAVQRERSRKGSSTSTALQEGATQETLSSSRPSEETEDSKTDCWLCLAPLDQRLSFTLPGTGAPRVICDGCFGRCYRDLYVSHLLGRSTRARLSPSQRLPVKGGDVGTSPLAAAGRALTATVQAMQPPLASVALGLAPKCPQCRTSCPIARNSPDGLPGSLCIDGQPHVRWRCVHCWHQHTRGGATCEHCGRSDGAHRWQCPDCLTSGRDGAGDPWGERVPSCQPVPAITSTTQFLGESTPAIGLAKPPFTDGEASAPAEFKVPPPPLRDEDYRGPGGRCGHCGGTYEWFIHDCDFPSTLKREILRPFEESLSEAFARCGFATDVDAQPPNDLFLSLADLLLGDRDQSNTLRLLLVRYMEDQEDTFLPYFYAFVANRGLLWHEVARGKSREPRKVKKGRKILKKEARQLFRQYRASIRSGEHGGDELCLQVASRYFNVVFHVFTADPSRWHIVFTGEDPDSAPATAGIPHPAHTPRAGTCASNTAARCFIRRWAPICTDEGEEVESGGRRRAPLFVLVDERLSHNAEMHLQQEERIHLFLRRSSPCSGYTVHKRSELPIAVSSETVLAVISASLEAAVEDVRKAEEIKHRLESRPAVPPRLRVPPKVDDEMDGVSPASSPVTPQGPPRHAPPSSSSLSKRRPTLPQALPKEKHLSRDPPLRAPSLKLWANRTNCCSPGCPEIPARAQNAAAVLPQPAPPPRVGRGKSFQGSAPVPERVSANALQTSSQPRRLSRLSPQPPSPVTVSPGAPPVPLSREPQNAVVSPAPPGDELTHRTRAPPNSPPLHPPRRKHPASSGKLPPAASVHSA